MTVGSTSHGKIMDAELELSRFCNCVHGSTANATRFRHDIRMETLVVEKPGCCDVQLMAFRNNMHARKRLDVVSEASWNVEGSGDMNSMVRQHAV